MSIHVLGADSATIARPSLRYPSRSMRRRRCYERNIGLVGSVGRDARGIGRIAFVIVFRAVKLANGLDEIGERVYSLLVAIKSPLILHTVIDGTIGRDFPTAKIPTHWPPHRFDALRIYTFRRYKFSRMVHRLVEIAERQKTAICMPCVRMDGHTGRDVSLYER